MNPAFGIHIKRLRVYGRHGVLPQERSVGAIFYVTLEAKVAVSEIAYSKDLLEGTINYDELTTCIHETMQEPANTLEHLSYKISSRLLQEFPTLTSVSLLVEKENPPTKVPCKEIGVKIELHR